MIVLMAFGKRGYEFAAHNLALSIKRNTDVPITLFTDNFHLNKTDYGVFDKIVKIKTPKEPAEAKTGIYDLLPYKENLYLDVDAVCLKDITPLIEHLKSQNGFYLTEVTGTGMMQDVINYSIWAKHEDIWDFFDLNETSIYPAIQSSYAFIRKGREAKKFFSLLTKFYQKGFPESKITTKWGGSIPDELLFSGTCAKMDIIPNGGASPIFFGWKGAPNYTFQQVIDRFYFSAIYGNGNGRTLTKLKYREWYDRLMYVYCKQAGKGHIYKSNYIMKDKWVNDTKQL